MDRRRFVGALTGMLVAIISKPLALFASPREENAITIDFSEGPICLDIDPCEDARFISI